MKKKIASILIATIVFSVLPTSVFADELNDFVEIQQVEESIYAFDDINQYGIQVQSARSNDKNNKYDYLSDMLENEEISYKNDIVSVYSLNPLVINSLNIPNLKEVIEIGYITDLYYTISYYTDDNEYIIIQYLKDGTVNCNVNVSASETDEEVDEPIVRRYDGTNGTVSEITWGNIGVYTSKASSKNIEFPTPAECGFTDTGKKGKVSSTRSIYLDAISKNVNAKVIHYESDYKKAGIGSLLFGAGTAVSTIAALFGWGESALINFLSGIGVLTAFVQGVIAINEEITLPKYPDYYATQGQYGDVYDPTNYKDYCRVVFNVGRAKYKGGLSSKGVFDYTRTPYDIETTDSEIYDQAKRLFNSCLVTNKGYNTCYFPA